MGDEQPTSRIVEMVMAFVIGIIMITAVAIPIGASQIASLVNIPDLSESNLSTYQTLLGISIVMIIIALIYWLVKYMTKSDR